MVGTEFTFTNPSDISVGQKVPFDLTLLSASIPISEIHHCSYKHLPNKTATANELSLVKEQTSYNDLLDGLSLSLKGYKIE
ncbi:MAG TPA: hypothetical protein VIA09_05735 [Nitrososphaeraceae archaeon]